MSDAASTFTVGLVQMRSGLDPVANLDAAARLIGEAKAGGADYVQTPEMTNIMELKRERLFAAIVQHDHPDHRGAALGSKGNGGDSRQQQRSSQQQDRQARHAANLSRGRSGRQPHCRVAFGLAPERPGD